MSVNLFSKEQSYQLVKELHDQATGVKVNTPVDLSSFISVAQATLVAGNDKIMNSLSVVLSKTLFALRRYTAGTFDDLQWSDERWGGIIRKINFADTDPEKDESYDLADGTSIDQYKIKKPNVLETRYVGSDIWQFKYTLFEDQINEAFTSPEALGAWASSIMLHMANESRQHTEDMARGLLCNLIATKNELGAGHVVHLLSEYNTATGLSLTATTVKQPANYPAFIKWCYGRIASIGRMMTARSQLFQQVITGKPIMRHTDYADQKFYVDADALEHIKAEVLSGAYNDNYLKLADTKSLAFFQSIDEPTKVQATPVYVDATGKTVEGSAQVVDNIFGIIFDKDCIGYNVIRDRIDITELNKAGLYRNCFIHKDTRYCMDVTEKAVLLLMD